MTIPACPRCNAAKDPYDLYLRDVFGLSIDIEDVPYLEFLRIAAVKSAMKEDRVRPARSIHVTYERQYGWLPTGDWGVVALKTVADGDKIREAFKWIVRGIWFFHRKTVLVLEDFACDGFQGENNLVGLRTRWPDFHESSASAVGSSVRYKFQSCETDPPCGTCLIFMYGRLFFQTRFNVSAMKAASLAAGLDWDVESEAD
jgi:hypothetical protein